MLITKRYDGIEYSLYLVIVQIINNEIDFVSIERYFFENEKKKGKLIIRTYIENILKPFSSIVDQN